MIKENTNEERLQALDSLRVYTLAEVAPVLGVNPLTLKNYIKSGRLRAVKIGGKWKVSQENLRRLIDGV